MIHLDYETRSAGPEIGKVGAPAYLGHPTTQLICACWTRDDETYIRKWWPRWVSFFLGPPKDDIGELVHAIRSGEMIAAHNAQFEWYATERLLSKETPGVITTPYTQWSCTAARCRQWSLPSALGPAAMVLDLRATKDDPGRALMLKVSKPKKPSKKCPSIWNESAEQFFRLLDYCAQDVRVEQAIHNILPELSAYERPIFELDHRINLRGVPIDKEICIGAKKIIKRVSVEVNAEIAAIMGVGLQPGKQVVTRGAFIKDWCNSQCRRSILPDMKGKETIDPILEKPFTLDGPIPEKVIRVLQLFRLSAMSSVAKYGSMLRASEPDSRIRGAFVYLGAGTTRWSSKYAQIHNLKRTTTLGSEYELGCELIKEGNIKHLRAVFGNALKVMSTSVRGVIVAPKGWKFIVVDYANVEARGVVWLGDDKIGLDRFRESDAGGVGVYEWMAGQVFSVDPLTITKDSIERFIGKQIVLGCGYGMGWVTFIENQVKFGVVVDPAVARPGVKTYRETFAGVPALWKSCEEAAINAVCNPGTSFPTDPLKRMWYRMEYLKGRPFLVACLPNGAMISYPNPLVEFNVLKKYTDPETGKVSRWRTNELSFMGWSKGQWRREKTWGGTLVENATQGFCRGFTAEDLLSCEKLGVMPVFHAHDEGIFLVREDDTQAIKTVRQVFTNVPPWARGFPLEVDIWEGTRYRK